MRYPDIREYITFLFSMLDEFSATQEKVSKKGRPQTFTAARSGVCFHLFGHWHRVVTTRNVNECPMSVTDAKCHPHQSRLSIKISDL